MNQYTTLKAAQIIDLKGDVQVELAGEQLLKALQAGDSISSGTVLKLAEGSEIILTFEDGSEQRIVAASERNLIVEEQDSSAVIAQTANQSAAQSTPDNVQADINAIQDLIESGDDIELPDTAAGGQVGNEGTDFVTLDRDGNELLAGAGYDTAELDNPTTPVDDPELLARSEQPTITQSDTNTVAEDSPATGNVLDNDSDLDDVLTVQSFTIAGDTTVYLADQTAIVEGGSLILNQDGSYTFTPAENYNGVLPVITYTTNTNATDTLTITVTPVSDLSDADEVVSLAEDTSMIGNVLDNAASADGTTEVTDFTVNGTTYAVGDTAALTEGDLTVNQDGTYSFVPAENFNGDVPVVTYTVSDGTNIDTSTLSINVTPVSDLTDADEVVSLAEDTSVKGNVLDNAASADGIPEVTDFTVNGTTYAVGDTAALTEGDLTVNQDGSYSFVPAGDFNGTVPVVTYTVSDGTNTDTSTLSINVTPESDLSDGNEIVSLAEDTSVTGNVLDNAASADGIPEVTDFTVDGTTYAVGDTAALTEGDLTFNQDGSYSFVPADNFNGAVPVVTYTVSDGTNTDTSTLSFNVTPESDLSDGNEVVSLAEDTSVTGNVLDNAASADGTPIITGFDVAGATIAYAAGDTASLTEGDLTINADGSYTFAPAANYNGPVPVATYTVSDGVNTDTSTLTIAVTPVSDLSDDNESVSTAEDSNVSGNVLTNAASADGTPVITGFMVAGSAATYAAGDTANLTEGNLTINSDGSYTFAPEANYNGPVPVATYTVSDGVNSDTSTLTIAVTPVSDLTDADENVSTSEDTNVSGNVLTNAASADGTPVVTGFVVAGSTIAYAAGATAALAEGDLTINADGSYTFAPAANYNGPVPVATYTVSDGVNSDTSTLTIGVTPVSDLTDADESVSTAEDTNVSGNVLSNATSADGTPVITGFTVGTISYAVGATAALAEGDLTVNADGSYTFAPAANYNGPVPVATYTVSDGVNSDTSTLTIAVTPVSDLTDADESVSTSEDTNVSGNVLSNAASADGTPVITGFMVAGSTATYAAGATAALAEGDLTINAGGSYTFAPEANYNGPVPVATYTVSDGVNSDTSTLTIAVTPVSDLTDADENVSTAEDTSVSGNVLTNASNADGTPVITGFVVAGSTTAYAAGDTAALTEGDLTINADGSYTFAPAANYNGPVPVVTYTVSDAVNSDTSTLTIAVTPVSDLSDDNESVSTEEDTNVSGSVLNNASSADGTPVVTGFEVAGSTIAYAAGATAALVEGDLTINADGSYTFAPAANYNGPVPIATYTVSDGVNTNTSTLTIAVTPASDLTDADESVSTAEDTNVSGNVLSNAFSADGTPIITGFLIAGSTATYAAGDTANLTEGNLTINSDGSYTFAPAANYNGPVPVATYTVSDGVNSDTSTLTIAVTPVSDLTDADENVSTSEDTNVSGNVLTNAASADGTPIITGFLIAGSTATYAAGDTANLTEGDLTINADGSYTFAPAANYNGPVPVATYTVSDGVNTDTSTLTIAVTPVSDLSDDNESVSTVEDSNVSGNVLNNAVSADGRPIITGFMVAGSTTAYAAGDTAALAEGDLTVNADGSYTFAPAANYNGPVPVATYTVSDGVNTDTSTLTIAVTPVSDLTDDNESVSTAEDTNVSGNVLTNASSADGTPVVTGFVVAGSTIAYAAGATAALVEGDLTINADGSYTFAPAANYNGPVPVATYTVSDGVNSDTSTLTIAVTPVSDLTDADESVSTAEDTNVSGNVLSNATSADGTPVITGFTVGTISYAVGATAALAEGDLTVNADGSYTFAPAANYNGPVPVATYTVSDGVNTDTSTLTIAVTPVSDLTDDNESVSTAEDSNVSGNVLTNASSADGTPIITGFDVAGATIAYAAGDTASLTEGDLTINADGSYTFAPAANYNGPVPVATYTVSDGVNSDTSTLTIAVTPVSDLTDADESVSTSEDTNVSGNVLTNAASADGTPLVTSFTVGTISYAVGATAALAEGDLTINADGSYTFAPAANYNGPVPVATYTVSDGVNTDSSTLTIAVTPVSDLSDDNESVSTVEDSNVSGNVLNNAVSADGTPIITGFMVAGSTAAYAAGDTAALTEGDLTINADGSYTFAPAANYNGPVPVATYTVSDGVNSDTSTLTIAVTPVSDLTDDNESVSTAEDTNVSGNVLSNATSADGTPVITGFTVGTISYAVGATAALAEGDLTVNADGSYTFAPAANYNGPVPVVTYTVSDAVNSDTSTLTIAVTPVSDLSDDNESVSTVEDSNVSGNVLNNAVSADGTPIITGFMVAGSTAAYAAGDTAALTEGDLTINADGSYTFAPAANYNGPVPIATYTVSDGVNSDTSTLTIAVTPVSNLTDDNESVSTAEDTNVSGNVLTNAASADGTPLVTSFTVGTISYAVGETAALAEGDLTINADGSYTFAPAANYNGPVPIATYTVSDGVNTDSSTLTIAVTPVSDLSDDNESVSTVEDSNVSGNVLNNAVSADGTPIITGFMVAGSTAAYAAGDTAALTEGDLTINADGSYTFAPAANYNGPVPVATYTVSDGVNSDTSTLTIAVTPVSDLTDDNESVSTAEDTNVSGNVLNNASSADGTPVITGFVVAGSTTTYAAGDTASLTEGDLTINADGSYTFAPAANYNGPVPVATYTVSDGVNTNTSTLTIAVTPVSDLTDADESVSTAEDTNVSGNVLNNASSADGTPVITGFVVAGSTTTYAAGDTASLTEGDLTINADGSYTFAPAANYNGPVPVATYTVSDGVNTNTSTLTIAVTPASDLTDADESVSTAEDTNVSGNVLNNASSADGTPVITGFVVAGSTTTYAAGDTASLTEGNLTINSDGSYTFAPAANYNGPVPVATYTVSDGVNTDTSTLTIAVTPVSDLTDADESVSTAEDTNVSGNVLNNASSADGTPIITGFLIAGSTTTYAAGDTASLTEGDLTINADGSYTFAPAANYNGPVPVATYTVEDGVNTDTSTLTIAVTPVSDLTDADESVSTAEDTNVSGNVLTNAASADGTPLVTNFTVGTISYAVGETAALAEGDLTINADGSYTFAPAANYNGPVPVATYTVSDGVNTDTSTLTIAVTPVSDLTDADESVSTSEDTNVSGNVLNNASSADGTPIITGFLIAGSTTTYAAGDTASLTEGDLTINADGSYTFAPAANYNGPVPVATYTVEDGVNTDTSTLTIAVTPVSDLTDADESVSTAEDTNVSGNVLSNAFSADGTPIITGFLIAGSTATYAAGDTASLTEGDLTINADGSYTFSPAANYNGPVPVATYTVSDGVNTDTSTLTIAVTPVSDLSDDNESVSTVEDSNVSGNVLNNAVSADGRPIITGFMVAGSTAAYAAGDTAALTEGDLTINADGSYTFAPAANYNGPVPVATYTVSDGINTDTSTLTIAVTPVSDLTDTDENVSTAEDTNVSGNVLTNAASADGTPVITGFVVAGSTATYAAGDTANLTEGDLTINADGSYTFAPAANYNGPVPVATYSVSDGVNTDTSTLTIEVTPVNEPPVAEDDNFTVNEGQSVSGNVITHDDGDGIKDTEGGDGAALTVTHVNGDKLVFDPSTGEARVDIKDGFILIKADGSFTYNNNGFELGSAAPSFTYTLSDGTNIDTAAVTINVVGYAPDAVDDINYIQLSKFGDTGTANRSGVKGNVIFGGSTGDNADSSVDGFGTPIITQVVYDGNTYLFSDTVTSYAIDTSYGTLTINSSGAYNFVTPRGMAMPSAEINLKFTYTIQDGDIVKPEADTADLTINIKPASTTTQSHDLDMDFDQTSGTIDTTLAARSLSHADEAAFTYAPDLDGDDLSDILIDGNTDGLEKYLAIMGGDESTLVNVELAGTHKDLQVEDSMLLEKDQADSLHTLSATVTNGLLADGGIIMSDAAANLTNTPIAEIDSPEVI